MAACLTASVRRALALLSALIALAAALRMPVLPPASDDLDRSGAGRVEAPLEEGVCDPGEAFEEAREGDDEHPRVFADVAAPPPPPKYHETHEVRTCSYASPDLSSSALPLRAPPACAPGA
jgi:hypothetical protein